MKTVCCFGMGMSGSGLTGFSLYAVPYANGEYGVHWLLTLAVIGLMGVFVSFVLAK